MPICERCNGKGYTNSGESCYKCSGLGTIEWFETEEYKRTGRMPKRVSVSPEKGYTKIGLVGGLFVGFFVYAETGNYLLAALAGGITIGLLATILRLFFKYIFIILLIAFTLYYIFV